MPTQTDAFIHLLSFLFFVSILLNPVWSSVCQTPGLPLNVTNTNNWYLNDVPGIEKTLRVIGLWCVCFMSIIMKTLPHFSISKTVREHLCLLQIFRFLEENFSFNEYSLHFVIFNKKWITLLQKLVHKLLVHSKNSTEKRKCHARKNELSRNILNTESVFSTNKATTVNKIIM